MSKNEPSSANESPPLSPKRFNAIVGYVTSVVVACAIIMWSVFNTWLNVLAYWANEKDDQAWGIAAAMVFFTCIVPFCFGLGILFRTLNKNKNR